MAAAHKKLSALHNESQGIEAESEYRTLRDMGVPLGQGRYLAPPVAIAREATA